MFSKGEKINNYSVVFKIAKNNYAESYVVRGLTGEMCFLKLINISLAMPSRITEEEIFRATELTKYLSHPNIIKYLDFDFFKKNGRQYGYYVTEMVKGESLDSILRTRSKLNVEEVRHIAKGILRALIYLHGINGVVMHNDLTTRSVMVLVGQGPESIKLTHFGHLRFSSDSADEQPAIWRNCPFMAAPEQLAGRCVPQSDIFGLGAIMYRLLYGENPWPFQNQGMTFDEMSLQLFQKRSMPLELPEDGDECADENLTCIISKALRNDISGRFASAMEMMMALDDEHFAEKEAFGQHKSVTVAQKDAGKGGFSDVAGLEDVKHYLQRNVLDILKNKEQAKIYRITIPNGILFYGPPGCGKSFIAEKFAQEAGYHYIFVKASDMASIFLHGTQGKIGALFDEARSKAPAIICFDEFDALVPSRDNIYAQYQSGEVNEFLTQLNNCGKDGVLVIASTNKPDLIDNAVLRRGRIDQVIYIPPPDQAAREQLFRLYLRDRPCSSDVNLERLAELTPHFVASDIAFLTNEAAICAAAENTFISQNMLERVIRDNHPSLSPETLRQYEMCRQKFEKVFSRDASQTIGFHPPSDRGQRESLD